MHDGVNDLTGAVPYPSLNFSRNILLDAEGLQVPQAYILSSKKYDSVFCLLAMTAMWIERK